MKPPMIFFAAVLCFISIIASAQGGKVPAQVKETFSAQYPGAEDVVYKDNLLNVSVNFTLKGEKMSASYTKKGQWKNTEKDWTYGQLPDVVKDGFQKSKYASWSIEDTKIIYKAGGIERYRIKVRKSDVQKKYLYFSKEGQLMEDNLTV